MAYHKTLFVFDIETIPDLQAARNLLGGAVPEAQLKEKLVEYHLEITGGKNDFIRQPFHQIVAISFLEAEIHQDEKGGEYYVLKDIRSGGNIDSTEQELVSGLFRFLANLKPRFVSFNGKTFDMPVLKYRAMKHDVQASWFYQSGDKWNNYSSKYSSDWHCDLLEVFSDYGSSARVKMKEVCALFNLPGKLDIDGSLVEGLYYQNKLQEIRDYCELDVLNTYLLYLIYVRHTGVLSSNNYDLCHDDLVEFLNSRSEEKPHFAKFLDTWGNII